MADPTRESPESPPPGSRRRRRRSARSEKRRRIALLLLLLALATGAVVLAPGLIDLIELGRGRRGPLQLPPRQARTDKPLPMRNWRFDFSMGPILELIEQSLNLEPFDLRRPLRIPFSASGMPRAGAEILLTDLSSFRPSFVPGAATPLGDLPPSFQMPDLPGLPAISAPGGDIPTGEPEFDPELADSDEEEELPPDPDPNPNPHSEPEPEPEPVPEPGALPLLLSTLALGAALRRRRRRV